MSELNHVFKVTDLDELARAIAPDDPDAVTHTEVRFLVEGDPRRLGDCVIKVKVGEGTWSLPVAELEGRWATAPLDRQWNDPGSGPGW